MDVSELHADQMLQNTSQCLSSFGLCVFMVSFIISVNDSFYLIFHFRIQRAVAPLLGSVPKQSKFTVRSMRIHCSLVTKIVTRVIFVQKRCRRHVCSHTSVDSQNGHAVNGV